MIDLALIVWFVLTGLSVVYVAWDAFTRNPELTVMKFGWILVTLYAGPIAAALYVLSCQEPGPYHHEEFIKPLWKQALGSTVHCLAGDATGIVIAAVITSALALPMAIDLVSEYLFGFGVGLFVFQALFMRDMFGGSYAKAVQRSFLPEWLSMNMVMAGMVPVMVALMSHAGGAMEPSSIRFWGVMSLAIMVGGVIAYPVNVWLVAAGLKHGMGSVRVLGAGGHSLEAEATRMRATSGEVADAHGAERREQCQEECSAGGSRQDVDDRWNDHAPAGCRGGSDADRAWRGNRTGGPLGRVGHGLNAHDGRAGFALAS
ncbi:MAG TPA: DUF4396 domain-containing protein [Methyloceanibacter sp.]